MIDIDGITEFGLRKAQAEERLADFVQQAWHVIDDEAYLHGWHMDAMAEHLEALARKEISRLLINVPPGTSKSSLANIYFPAWLWGPMGWPQAKYLGASHDLDLAIRDSRRMRQLVESEWYQERWPLRMTTDQNEKKFFENESRGWRVANAVKGITGRRGHFVAWDDPLSPEKAYSDTERDTANRVFAETLPSRMIDPKESAILIIMQRLHEEDVSGYILARDLGYTHLMIPMEFETQRRCHSVVKPRFRNGVPIDVKPVRAKYDAPTASWFPEDQPIPEDWAPKLADRPWLKVYPIDPRKREGQLILAKRFPRDVVERDKKAMGSFAVAGQFQQRPVPREGGLFKRGWFEFVQAAPARVEWVRGWDLAATDDNPNAARTASVKMGEDPGTGLFYIAHSCANQLGPMDAQKHVLATAKMDGPRVEGSIPQDPGQSGKSQVAAMIRDLAGFNYRASPETGDKFTRAMPVAAQAEAGNVKIVQTGDPIKDAWIEDFLSEIITFSDGAKFKDRVDAMSRAFSVLVTRAPTAIIGKQG